jgi:hypothetical protein
MRLCCTVALFFFSASLCMADVLRGAILQPATLYVSPDATSSRLGDASRGREVVVLETSRDWTHVEVNLTAERTVTGWVMDRYVISGSTPGGDRILFGEAVDSEDQASQRDGRKDAARMPRGSMQKSPKCFLIPR